MFAQKYYNGVIRKYVVYFGTLFNNIEIDRVNRAGTTVQTMKVPISYGPRQKYIIRGDVDPNADRQIAVQLPRMSFEMTNFRYDSERRMNPMKKLYAASTHNYNLKSVFNPQPFNIDFELNIAVKNAEDGVRILEQILPYFTPEYTATLKLLDDMPDLKFDIPVVFLNLNTRDEYEGDYVTRRQLIHTLSFEVKGYVFGPVTEKSDIIKQANTQFHVDPGAAGVFTFPEDVASKVVITPGLDANGNPTSNSSVSINKDDINANSNYGYITANTFNG
jgi:hypothetical protein